MGSTTTDQDAARLLNEFRVLASRELTVVSLAAEDEVPTAKKEGTSRRHHALLPSDYESKPWILTTAWNQEEETETASSNVSLEGDEDERKASKIPRRSRTVSFESVSGLDYPTTPKGGGMTASGIRLVSPAVSGKRVTLSAAPSPLSLEHHDWRVLSAPSMSSNTGRRSHQGKAGKSPAQEEGDDGGGGKAKSSKRDKYVGMCTEAPVVRGTLRKGFSWRQYPELEEYLRVNREEYFSYSSMNYSMEQRRYNNQLTQGLLDLANEHGYVFDHFTFAQVRDRLRCYYKSYVQALKKKGKR